MKPLANNLQQTLDSLPDSPGCYRFYDAHGRLLYVGKAASLKDRVRSYFGSAPAASIRQEIMMRRVASLDWVVTDSELEALLLENNLIKQHKPFFNVSLADDKTYPYIRLSLEDDYPRLYVVRRTKKDGSRYFGPYGDVGAMRKTLKIIGKVFQLRTCNTMPPPEKGPCLDYHIGRCCGPCINAVTKEEYAERVKETIHFLDGKADDILKRLKQQMKTASEELRFEDAAKYRDDLSAIESALEPQKVASPDSDDLDIIAVASDANLGCAQVFSIREGHMRSRDNFDLKGTQEKGLPEVIAGFIQQYYSDSRPIPKDIILPNLPEDREVLESWLSQLRGTKVSLRVPQLGQKLALLKLAQKNTELYLNALLQSAEVRRERDEALLKALQEHFHLPTSTERVECYDISTIQGQHTVGSLVVFTHGVPDKKAYRIFKIKDPEARQDDYAALQEVISRRFAAKRKQDDKFASKPDLIVVDGGKGQLNAVLEALKEVEVEIPTLSLAKKEETIFTSFSGRPLRFPTQGEILHFFQRIRDEAHRFALSHHIKQRAKGQVRSLLEEIPGIGPERRKNLMAHFETLERIAAASLEELTQCPTIDQKTAQNIFDFLHSPPSEVEAEAS